MFARAVGGVGHYGNCTGVPNVGGEAVFDDRYAANCLVNAMCVGELPAERVTRASMSGPGNLVVLYGATTGRDGIGGASVLASQELSEGDDDKRPSVQVGDPFTGKKLIEASLELVEGGHVASLQDCGAAGLASSLAEMASRGGAGVDVHLDRVPLREEGMAPWEIMVSESQERMICVTERYEDVEAVCAKWELECAAIGVVTDSGRLRCFFENAAVGDLPAGLLTDECPRYPLDVQARELEPPVEVTALEAGGDQLRALLAGSEAGSRSWIYGQYDQLVQSRTVRRPGLDAAVLRLRPSYRGIAVSLDGAGRLAFLDPGRVERSPSSRPRATSRAPAGGRWRSPTASTSETRRSPRSPGSSPRRSRGWRSPARPWTSRSSRATSRSTTRPTAARSIRRRWWAASGSSRTFVPCPGTWREGDVILLAGAPELRLDGSAYQARFLGGTAGRPPMPDLPAEVALIRLLTRVAPLASCVHDLAEGGLAVCLAEAAIASDLGAELDVGRGAVELFGEGGGQAIVACGRASVERIEANGVPLRPLGVVGGDRLLGMPVAELREAHASALPRRLD